VQLILIRHGRPERVDHDPGGADPGLTELGHRQAVAMAEYLRPEKIDALYMSPQQRAIETAAPLAEAFGHTANIVDGIAEFDLGHPSYIPGEETGPLTREELDRLTLLLTGTSFQTRVHQSIGKIIADHPGETVAAVCHGGVISSVLADLLGVDPMHYFDSHYTSITRIKASADGRKSLASFNECHWLREL
jgi:broad specificity phosphatase PhoE